MMNSNKTPKSSYARAFSHLLYSLLIDGVGMLNLLIPTIPDASDVFVAPFLSLAIYAIYRSSTGAVVGYVEEIWPGMDIIPTATLVWCSRYLMNEQPPIKKTSPAEPARQTEPNETAAFQFALTPKLR